MEKRCYRELSGGQQQRVLLARALCATKKLLILDEPVSGLDPITSTEVLYYITQIIRSERAITITITHDLRNLENLGDRILFLEDGKALFFGSPREMQGSNLPVLQGFLAAAR